MVNCSLKRPSFWEHKVGRIWLSILQNILRKRINQMKNHQMYIVWLGSGLQKLDLASQSSNLCMFSCIWINIFELIGILCENKCSSRTILEKYLKRAVTFSEELKAVNRKSLDRKCQTHFHLAHYADALFKSHEERLNSSEWQAALRLRKHKVIVNS